MMIRFLNARTELLLGVIGSLMMPVSACQPALESAPLFTVNADNRSDHVSQLTPGLVALLDRYPDSLHLPVFPTTPACEAPDWLVRNSAWNDQNVQLDPATGLLQHYRPGVPFPQPTDGLELIHNHLYRWRGLQLQTRSSDATVQTDGDYSVVTRVSTVRFDAMHADLATGRLLSLISRTTAPARQAGGGVLVHEPLNPTHAERAAWIWDAGRRRALRAPDASHDTPLSSSDGLVAADELDGFNGATDRYQWQIIGQPTVLVPYHNAAMLPAQTDLDTLLQPGHLKPSLTRFEARQVWHLRASLKPEYRHRYAQRDLYIDPDSWMILMAEHHDQQGQLWKVNLSYVRVLPEVQVTLPVVTAYHDLRDGRYFVQGINDRPEQYPDFGIETPKDALFTPAGLRRYVK